MRLTAELVQSSLSYLNPLNERELDLRGHKIPAIENLAVARDQDCIDLTDNSISTLSNFPLSPRLHTLLLARNRLISIQPNLSATVPHLTNLVLTANNLAELSDIDPLRHCTLLTHLSLLENPLARKDNYRLWVIWRCPTVRFLDFAKVRDTEREAAKELFGATQEEPTELARKVMGVKSSSRTFDVGSTAEDGEGGGGRGVRVKLTEKERKRVEEMIRNAKSLGEIAKLEKELNEGKVPAGAMDLDD